MRKTVTVIHVEPMGKSGEYAKIYAITDDPRFPALAVCVAHKSALPSACHVGSSLPAATFYGKSGLSFEPLCDTVSEEGGVNAWVKQQLS